MASTSKETAWSGPSKAVHAACELLATLEELPASWDGKLLGGLSITRTLEILAEAVSKAVDFLLNQSAFHSRDALTEQDPVTATTLNERSFSEVLIILAILENYSDIILKFLKTLGKQKTPLTAGFLERLFAPLQKTSQTTKQCVLAMNAVQNTEKYMSFADSGDLYMYVHSFLALIERFTLGASREPAPPLQKFCSAQEVAAIRRISVTDDALIEVMNFFTKAYRKFQADDADGRKRAAGFLMNSYRFSKHFVHADKEDKWCLNMLQTLEWPVALLEALLQVCEAPQRARDHAALGEDTRLAALNFELLHSNATRLTVFHKDICRLDDHGVPVGQGELLSGCQRLQALLAAGFEGAHNDKLKVQKAVFHIYGIVVVLNSPCRVMRSRPLPLGSVQAVVQAVREIALGWEVMLALNLTQKDTELLESSTASLLLRMMFDRDLETVDISKGLSAREAASMLQTLLSTLEKLYTVHAGFAQRSACPQKTLECLEKFCVDSCVVFLAASGVCGQSNLDEFELHSGVRKVMLAANLFIRSRFKTPESALKPASVLQHAMKVWAETAGRIAMPILAPLDAPPQTDDTKKREVAAAVMSTLHTLEAVTAYKQYLTARDLSLLAIFLHCATNPNVGIGVQLFMSHPKAAKLFREQQHIILSNLGSSNTVVVNHPVVWEAVKKLFEMMEWENLPPPEFRYKDRAMALATLPCGYLGRRREKGGRIDCF